MNDDVCRICRGEETPDEPLFHPCKCSGSIKYVHQDCLLEWLQHARVRTKCDVCGTEYKLRKVYLKHMPDTLNLWNYAIFLIKMAGDHCQVIYYTVRAVLMVSAIAVMSKYLLEFSVIFVETMNSHRACEEFLRRTRQQPPRGSVVPGLDKVLGMVLAPSELRSALINGVLLLVAMVCTALFCWFIAMWVLNEQALLHDLEHIELGEMSHMDQGDDEDLLADLHPSEQRQLEHRNNNVDARRERLVFLDAAAPAAAAVNNNGNDINDVNDDDDDVNDDQNDDEDAEVVVRMGGRHLRRRERLARDQEHEPGLRETLVRNTDRGDIYADPRLEHEARREAEQIAGNIADDDEGAEDLNVFIGRLIADLFGAPNRVTLFGFISAAVLFSSASITYAAFYWPCLELERVVVVLTTSVLTHCFKVPQHYTAAFLQRFQDPPRTVSGHLALVVSGYICYLTIVRLTILYHMPMLLQRTWGKSLAIFSYQVYAVLKTILMTVIETVGFPQFCGTLLHIAVLPITPHWTWHYEVYKRHPYWTLFLQWLSGYLYMHAFQCFVNACRRFFRRGVFFFLHDNDPVYFMRSIMLLSLPKQLRRIAHSAAIYGGFILLGVGSASVLVRVMEPRWSWPLELVYWPGTDVLRLWPCVIAFGAFSVPFCGGANANANSPKALKDVFTLWITERVWLRMFDVLTRKLDLHSWFFDSEVRPSAEIFMALKAGDKSLGYFVRAPVDVPLRPRSSLNLFVPVDPANRRLDGKTGVMDNELLKYTIVWRPPHFKWRIFMLAFGVWSCITAITLALTLVPLQLGRLFDVLVLGHSIRNDLLLMVAGLSVCLPLYAYLLRISSPIELAKCKRFAAMKGAVPTPRRSLALISWLWALSFAILSMNAHSPWQHWLLWGPISGGASSAARVNFAWAINLAAFFTANMFSAVWCNAVATADFFVAQVLLEIIGIVPRSCPQVFSCSVALSALRVYRIWNDSKYAQQLSETVREALYLERLEVCNYDDED